MDRDKLLEQTLELFGSNMTDNPKRKVTFSEHTIRTAYGLLRSYKRLLKETKSCSADCPFGRVHSKDTKRCSNCENILADNNMCPHCGRLRDWRDGEKIF